MPLKENNRALIRNGELWVSFNTKFKKVNLSKYNILKILGSGANAVTVLGKHKITGRNDAIKVYLPNKKSPQKKVSVDQYIEEVRKISSLKHPNIVTVYTAEKINPDFYIVTMEYIDGVTLKEWLDTHIDDVIHSRDIVLRIQIAKELLNTVNDYQSHGVIHGDLHDRNVIIDKNNHVHLIDFGSSCFSKEGQSRSRENFLISDMVRNILSEAFDAHFFDFIIPNKLNDKIKSNDDVRVKYPLLLTKTLTSYVEMLDLMEQMPLCNLQPKDVAELCAKITEGIYINFEYAAKKIYNQTSNTLCYDNVEKIIFENINESTFTNVFDSTDFSDKLLAGLLEVYYSMSLETKRSWDIKSTKECIIACSDIFTKDELDICIEIILNSNETTFQEFISNVNSSYRSLVNNNIQFILYKALELHLGQHHFVQEVWVRLNMIKCDGINEEKSIIHDLY